MDIPPPSPLITNTNQAENWILFRTAFQRYIQSLSHNKGTTESKEQVTILKNVIGAPGMVIYDQLPDTISNDIDTVLNALEAVSFAFDATFRIDIKSTQVAQSVFNARMQQVNESFDEFYNDITRLAFPCRFGDRHDVELCQRLVDGIADPNTRQQLQKIDGLTLAKAVGFCRMVDLLRSRSTDTLNGIVVPTASARDVEQQNGSSTECVLRGNCAKGVMTTDKDQVENPFTMKTEHMCGFSWWHPAWMQRFANVKTFLIVYGLLGTIQSMASLYFMVTLTTVEKRFKIPSYITGIVLSGNEISQILFSVILSYAGGQRNRPRWLAWGIVFSALSCFILALPHFMYGAGEDALHLTAEFQETQHNKYLNLTEAPKIHAGNKMCSGQTEKEECEEKYSVVPLVLIFLSQFVLGIGTTLYYTLGQPYMDDNSKKTNTPMILAYAMSLRMLGPVVGFVLGSVSLRMYIDPWKTPLINNKDPRWLGAWWFGWVLLGLTMFVFSWLLGMFPKELPKMRLIRQESERPRVLTFGNDEDEPFRSATTISDSKPEQSLTVADFFIALKRVLTNKVLIFNILSSVFYILSASGFITFFSKYMEVQFFKSSADATIVAGPITLIGMVFGIMFSGWFISKYQPSPSKLFMWNVIVGFVPIAVQVGFLFLHCESTLSTVDMGRLNLSTQCNANCFCDNVQYSPVCDPNTGTTFFSPCHAGCQSWNEEAKLYSNCSCGSSSSELPEWMSTTISYTSDTTPVTTLLPNVNGSFELPSDTTHSAPITILSTPVLKTTTTLSSKVNGTDEHSYTTETSNLDNENIELEDTLKSRRRRDKPSVLSMIPGVCMAGCSISFWTFTAISCLGQLMGSTGRIGNVILNLRVVAVEDKGISSGLLLMMISLFALIPGPILYGYIIDSTCLIWNSTCGTRGNCQLYDQTNFRYYLNIAAMVLGSMGVFFDVLVWWYGSNVDLYGVEEDRRKQKLERKNQAISPLMSKRS